MTSPLRDEKIVSGTYRNGAKYISLTQGPTSRSLTCPNFQAGFSKRQYALNAFVNGGPRSAALPGGTYGYLVVPSPQPYRSDFTVTAWDPANPTSTGYRLGAKLDRFSSSQFMICEQEHANDVSSTTAGGTGKVTLGGYAPDNYPPYSKLTDGNLSFRHNYFERANFLFIDAHVEQLTPNDDVWSGRRFDIQNK